MAVDEAHRFFDHDAAVGESTFALIAREGNRNKLGLCLFTQLPSDLPHEAYANTGITVSFALPSAREREHFARNAPTDIGALEAELRHLPVGESIAAVSGLRPALHVRLPRGRSGGEIAEAPSPGDNPNGTVFGLSGFDGVGAKVVVSGHNLTRALCWRHSGEEVTTAVQNAGSRFAHARGLGHVAPGLG